MVESKVFSLIQNECLFAQDLLSLGVNQLSKADIFHKGIYYQCLTTLSTGIERLQKLIIVLDKYKTDGTFLSENELKRLGHSIVLLYNQCDTIGKKYNISTDFSETQQIYDEIIETLSLFASYEKENRYYNLNYLSIVNDENGDLPKDCIYMWHEKVDGYIWENKIPDKIKRKLICNSMALGNMINEGARISFESETREEISDGTDMLLNINVSDVCKKYRRLYVVQIIRYLSNILNCFSQDMKDENIPYLPDFFLMFRLMDEDILRRKTYNI